MKTVIKYCFFSMMLMLFSCKHDLPANEYVGYVQNKDNELKKVIQTGEWEFTMQYKPYDYILLQESKGNIRSKELDKRRNDLKGTAWFNISIKRIDGSITPLRYGISSLEEYNQRLDYFLNKARGDIRLIYDNQTLLPSSYIFENNYNLTPQETIVVGFTLPDNEAYPKKNMQLSFNDQVYKNGIIKTMYKSEVLENIPKVIY